MSLQVFVLYLLKGHWNINQQFLYLPNYYYLIGCFSCFTHVCLFHFRYHVAQMLLLIVEMISMYTRMNHLLLLHATFIYVCYHHLSRLSNARCYSSTSHFDWGRCLHHLSNYYHYTTYSDLYSLIILTVAKNFVTSVIVVSFVSSCDYYLHWYRIFYCCNC